MKRKIFMYTASVLVAVFFAGCGGSKNSENKEDSKPESETVKNLKNAVNGETTASTKYAEFAKKAKEEGYLSVSKLFEATSKSESIHAQNHLKVLENLGITYEAKVDTFTVKSTAENLEVALKGEKYEVETMYPGFIKQAEQYKEDRAILSFNYAFDTEKKHIKLYQAALDDLTANKDKSQLTEYYVCPKCGFTYDKNDVKENCEICATSKEQFFVIK